MKSIILSLILTVGIIGIAKADTLGVRDGVPYITISTATTDFHEPITSSVTAIIAELQSEGFTSRTKTEWMNKINSRLNETYADKRAREYPKSGDQLDLIMKTIKYLKEHGTDIGADGEKLISDCEAVKQKYPK